jgi:hypothetical protein
MTRLMIVPDSREFSRLVEQYEDKYKELDRTYLTAIKDFNGIIGSFGDYEVESILYPYLLRWGKMMRVLGYKGCSRISEKLREMEPQLDKFQKLTLSTIDLSQMSDKVEALYDELLNADWESDKGRTKRVGPTATSKVLHIVAPNVFIMWDRKIRDYYGFKDSGAEYVRFLANMKDWLENLSPRIEELSNKYQKSHTKIIDEYNWLKCRCK